MIYGHQIEGLILPQVKKEIEVGLIRDEMLITRQQIKKLKPTQIEEKKNLLAKLAKVTEEYKNYRQTPYNFYGASGTSKTVGTLNALTKAGIPAIVLETSIMSDASNITGVMVKTEERPGVITTNYTKPYFIPLPVIDEEGDYVLRKDGGIMWDYEALGYQIANYDELFIRYDGDINQAPMYAILLDDFNKTASQDVKAALFGVLNTIDKKAFNGYLMPNFLISTSGNPESFEYATNGTMDDTAFASRLIHVRVLTDVTSVKKQVVDMGMSSATQQVISKMPELGVPNEADESLDYRPAISNSLRAVALMNTVIELYQHDKDALYTALSGIYGIDMSHDIIKILETKREIPTLDDIILRYPEVQKDIKDIIDENEQGITNMLVEGLKDLFHSPKEKLEEKQFFENVDNVVDFLLDIPQTHRVDVVVRITDRNNPTECNVSGLLSRNRKFMEKFKAEHALIMAATKANADAEKVAE